jgi:hypothetical protein
LLFGAAETSQPDFAGIPRLTLYTIPSYGVWPLVASGVPGLPGVGAFDLVSLVTPELAGAVLYAQVLVLDPGAPSGISSSNGIERAIGF